MLAQSFQDFEIVVVDDGSTDRTTDVMASFPDPRIRWIAKPHSGIPDTYNRGVLEARCAYLARLGHDDRMHPNRLELQVATLDAHPEVGVVHTDASIIDEHGRVTGTWTSRQYGAGEVALAFFRQQNDIIDPSTMVRRAVYDDVGLYDLDFPMCNDIDLWVRAARKWRFKHLALPLTSYRRHGGNFSDERNQAIEREEVERLLERLVTRHAKLEELVPEIDWTPKDGRPKAEAESEARRQIFSLLVIRGFPRLADRLFPDLVF